MNAALLAIDQMKAFDRMEFSFIFKALERFGFGPQFISWVKLCYTNICSAIKINGFVSEFFSLTRGVRQGCPLSMGLFCICSEYLAEFIRNSASIKGLKLPNSDKILKIIQYADDTTIFVADVKELNAILCSFRIYENATGAKVNVEKTEGLWLGAYRGRQDFPQNISWTSDSIKLLGVYLGNVNTDSMNWTPCINKLKVSLNLWKQRDLSYTGRSVIINSIACSKIWYLSNIIYTPEWVITEINTLIFEFFWKGKKHIVNKNVLHMSQCKGGQNIVNIGQKIKSQQAVWISKMLNCNHKCAILFNYFIGLYRNSLFGADILHLNFLPNAANSRNMPNIYREMLKSWNSVDIYLLETPSKKSDILAQHLFLNGNILYRDNSLWSDTFMEVGLMKVCDIWDDYSGI